MAQFLSPLSDDEFVRRTCKTRNVDLHKFKIIQKWPDVVMSKSKHKRVHRTTLCCWVLSSDTIGNKFLTNEFLHN